MWRTFSVTWKLRSDDLVKKSLFHDLGESMRHPEFWAFASWLDLVVKYRQSRLGILWLIAPAALYVWGLGFFFSSMSGQPFAPFAVYVALGWLIFRVIQSVIIESTTAFPAASSFIMDGHARLTDFVLQVTAKALFYFLASMPVLIIALAYAPHVSGSGLAFGLITFPLIVLNALWIGVVFALIGARFPDLGQFISNIFMFAFLLTPIIWQAQTMPAGSMRGHLMRINPLFHMVELVRAPILGEPLETTTFYYIGAMTIIGWCVAAIAYRRYARFVPTWI